MKKVLIIILSFILIIGIGCFFFLKDKGNIPSNEGEISSKDNGNKIKEEEKTTKDKTAIFFGDSITQGWLTNGYSYANYINDNYDLKSVTNAGIADYRVSTYDDPKKWLVDEVKSYIGNSYDYIILQGGINDVLYLTPLGDVYSSQDNASYDINTFAGGLETYLSTVKANWPDVKIGYIITYYTPKYSERGITWSYQDYLKYVNLTKKILDKWDIPYLDLFDSKFTELLDVENRTYLPDYLHLNKEGYELVSPYIYKWMRGL